MKKPAGKLIYAFEALGLLALVLLEYISDYKGGLMKHLYSRKMEYLFSWYTSGWIVVHTLVISGLLMCGIVWMNCGKQSGYLRRCLYRALTYGVAVLIAFYTPAVQALIVYPYLLMVLEMLFVVEAVKIALHKLSPKPQTDENDT